MKTLESGAGVEVGGAGGGCCESVSVPHRGRERERKPRWRGDFVKT